MSVILDEIASQPQRWRQATELLPRVRDQLPEAGRRVAVIGCGTSFFIAQAVALLRESLQLGESDAFVASEMPAFRRYDSVLAISRSGTTTEVLRALDELAAGTHSLAITALPSSPVAEAARQAIVLDFADEVSVVQTRFATTVLALLRAYLGQNLDRAIADAESALAAEPGINPAAFEHFVFLGHAWTIGLAAEAALKLREAAGAWTESYYAMEYRHGPISVAGPGSLVWLVGVQDDSLVNDVRATGATVIAGAADPMAELVKIQRMGVALAQARGLNPDQPQHLSRSVVLP